MCLLYCADCCFIWVELIHGSCQCSDSKTFAFLTPEGKRKRGRSKTIWRRTDEMGARNKTDSYHICKWVCSWEISKQNYAAWTQPFQGFSKSIFENIVHLKDTVVAECCGSRATLPDNPETSHFHNTKNTYTLSQTQFHIHTFSSATITINFGHPLFPWLSSSSVFTGRK